MGMEAIRETVSGELSLDWRYSRGKTSMRVGTSQIWVVLSLAKASLMRACRVGVSEGVPRRKVSWGSSVLLVAGILGGDALISG